MGKSFHSISTLLLLLCALSLRNNPVCLAKNYHEDSWAVSKLSFPPSSSLQVQRPKSNERSFVRRSLSLNIRGGGGGFPSSKSKHSNRVSRVDDKSKASILTSVFNLANNVAGAGILTLAAGKARSGTGWIPSIAVSLCLAGLSAHTFTLIGKACELTGQPSFKGLWAEAFEPSTAWVVDSMVFTQCFLVCILYTGLLGDIFSSLLSTTASPTVKQILPELAMTRNGVILIATIFLLWPLNLIRDMSKLGFTSILGLVAVLYTVFFILWRAVDGSYSIGSDPVGRFVSTAAFTPSFVESTMFNIDLRTLVLVSNLGLAYISHYNGPAYWQSLASATSSRFSRVSFSAYLVLAILYVTTMVAGYATFGDNCQGNILINYAPEDILAMLGQLATGFSLLFGFPLVSNGAREGFKNTVSALGWESITKPNVHFPLVTILLVITTCLALGLRDIQLVSGLTGAVMGSALVYVCPPLLYTKIVRKTHGEDSMEYKQARWNLLLIPFGCFTAAMGVFMTLRNAK